VVKTVIAEKNKGRENKVREMPVMFVMPVMSVMFVMFVKIMT